MPVVALLLIWLVFELSIFRDSSFRDPWIDIAVMLAIGAVYLAWMLLRRGRQALMMPEMRSIDAEFEEGAAAAESAGGR